MISEGTDIPRLQVCCHISSVKTELYFRQVLGRILRVNGSMNQQAWLFTFAEQNLIEFSERIEQDIPESCMFAKASNTLEFELEDQCASLNEKDLLESRSADLTLMWSNVGSTTPHSNGPIAILDELQLGVFKHRIISAFLTAP